LELPWLCRAITLCANLRLGWGLKQSCNLHQKLSNSVLHATYTQGSWVDSWLFVIRSQIANLTPGLSFCHNLCCMCPNWSCKPILDIYVSTTFWWYKDLFNTMCFDICNRSLKVWESTGTPTPKMGAHLGVWVFILTLSHIPFGPCPCKPLPWLWAQG